MLARQESVSRHKRSAMGLAEALDELRARREREMATALEVHSSSLDSLRGQYQTQLERTQKHGDEVLKAQMALTEQAVEEMDEAHQMQVAELEGEKAALREEKATSIAHLPLPDLLRRAMEDGQHEMQEVHAREVEQLRAEISMERQDKARELADAAALAAQALTEQKALNLSREEELMAEARLEHELQRTRQLEMINARSEVELSQLRIEQAAASRNMIVVCK